METSPQERIQSRYEARKGSGNVPDLFDTVLDVYVDWYSKRPLSEPLDPLTIESLRQAEAA
jgi:hypothetical protein